MKIQWLYASPIDIDEVIKVANRHNITLPDLLLKAIMQGNNGAPEPDRFFYDNGANEDIFNTMLSYNPDDIENVYSALEALKECPGLYPFGNDPGGNLICLNGAKVVLWKHETDQTVPVADSIEVFFEGLH